MSEDVPWIEELETKVEASVEEIRRLRAENVGLREKLAAAESDGGSTAGDEAEWKEERDRVKERVEGIVDRLGDLLGE